jgi:hypothetical protein
VLFLNYIINIKGVLTLGVKFTREYEDILAELVESVYKIENFFEFFDMTSNDWSELSGKYKKELVKTLSDDLFYALADDETISLGNGSIQYDKLNSKLYIFNNDVCVKTLSLV